MQIILASASKRRQELLNALGLKFKVLVSDFEEDCHKAIKNPVDLVKKLALGKALAVKKKIKDKNFLIISADTIVAIKNNHQWQILGKPKSRQEAKNMLDLLKGKQHEVLTALTLLSGQGVSKTIVEKTLVWFNDFPAESLEKYLDKGFYLDRAGAYGIQDEGCKFIKKFIGSYTNILGLPIEQLIPMLKEFN